MTYACSDIHGDFNKYKRLLKELDLKSTDTLYVLGDVIDRGPHGIKILQEMMYRSNIIPIIGNHEFIAALAIPALLKEGTGERLAGMTETQIDSLNEWIVNGGTPTLRELNALPVYEREEILDYIRDMDVYEEVTVGERDFLLTHSGIRGYSPDKPLEAYNVTDFMFGRPIIDGSYAYGKYQVFGHTPTRVLRKSMGIPQSDDILIDGGQIAIDCACAYGKKLGAICLDDLEAVYV